MGRGLAGTRTAIAGCAPTGPYAGQFTRLHQALVPSLRGERHGLDNPPDRFIHLYRWDPTEVRYRSFPDIDGALAALVQVPADQRALYGLWDLGAPGSTADAQHLTLDWSALPAAAIARSGTEPVWRAAATQILAQLTSGTGRPAPVLRANRRVRQLMLVLDETASGYTRRPRGLQATFFRPDGLDAPRYVESPPGNYGFPSLRIGIMGGFTIPHLSNFVMMNTTGEHYFIRLIGLWDLGSGQRVPLVVRALVEGADGKTAYPYTGREAQRTY